MSYDLLLVRREVKEKIITENLVLDELLENNDNSVILDFTDIQIEKLKKRLKIYNFITEGQESIPISYSFNIESYGISATLFTNQLSFSSGFNENAVFEILQTASEFCDNENFAFYNYQNGLWTDYETY